MNKPNDGGPAFPSSETIREPDRPYTVGDTIVNKGMSLRDWFAGQALAGLSVSEEGSFSSRAEWCVKMADALLAELEKDENH
jgi:hypothetical protein